MKIRNGFVSNSSSSSFIISISKSARCPHCGRSDQNILDVIESSNVNDSEVIWTDPKDYLTELTEEIICRREAIRGYNKRDDNEIVYNNYDSGSNTVGELKQWGSEYLDEATDRWNKITKAVENGDRIAMIDIDYHDTLSNYIMQEQIKIGTIKIIGEWG